MGEREFYVGYLKLPPGMRRFIVVLVPLLLIGAAGAAVTMTLRQGDPGNGAWHVELLDTLTGVVERVPYAVMRDDRGFVLLVGEGKHGFGKLGAYRLRGHRIERDGVRMFEVVEAEKTAGDAPLRDYYAGPSEAYRGRGQIIDPKCYLGVMRPGEGKVHKACATLCIKGGIPPMFRDEATGELYLLTDAAGGAILDPILPYVADPIEVEGRAQRIGDLRVLRVDAGSIRRIEE